ncbi:sorbitol dehydrogenase family protein [Larsenimonas salina]|uniref:sorbitol dehydrogenase family protein n=1 Tax=Larsenimonas salina TaxID=1295565 RepID=UPI002072EB0A|nr:sorbitol dehydrogenase family protein [Larsenimonas salina]MCM5704816.1 sorbitol dehydrogenase family protein [Larsenimonas salina]
MTSKHAGTSSGQMTRRQLLGYSLAGAAGAAALVSPLGALAASNTPVQLGTFMTVSQAVCEKSALNPAVGRALMTALSRTDDGFAEHLNALSKALEHNGLDALAGNADSAVAQTAKRILSAWYTGIVGEGEHARVVTYRHALQFQAVDDVLVIRTYCPNEPGFWAEKPDTENV